MHSTLLTKCLTNNGLIREARQKDCYALRINKVHFSRFLQDGHRIIHPVYLNKIILDSFQSNNVLCVYVIV